MNAAEPATHLDALKKTIKQFEAAQQKYREFGAQDTEPDGVFQGVLMRAIKGKDAKVPTTGRGWELYASSMDCTEAANALAETAMACVRQISACPLGESAAVIEYVKDYCWRYN